MQSYGSTYGERQRIDRRDQETVIYFSLYKICNGSNWGPNLALRGMAQSNLGLGIFQETKVIGRIHTCVSVGYLFFATDTLSWYLRGVDLFYQEAPHF